MSSWRQIPRKVDQLSGSQARPDLRIRPAWWQRTRHRMVGLTAYIDLAGVLLSHSFASEEQIHAKTSVRTAGSLAQKPPPGSLS